MTEVKWTPEKIEGVMREVAADVDRGLSVEQSLKRFGVASSMYYRWKAKYGVPEAEQQVKELLAENKRLHRVVSQQALDIAMLREVARGKF
jgi:putative transposase